MAERSKSRVERFQVRRTARCAIRGPEDPTQVRSLWFVLHGYGTLATDFTEYFDAVDDGTRLIVAPEGLSRFYDASTPAEKHAEARVRASWMTREDRLQEIDDYLSWLQLAYEGVSSRLSGDVPLTVLGFSQGAAAASRWVATGRVPANRLVCWGATLAPELDLGASSALRRQRCVLVMGDRDRFAGPAQIAAERARLDAAGFEFTFETFEGGHRLDDAVLLRLSADDR